MFSIQLREKTIKWFNSTFMAQQLNYFAFTARLTIML